MATHRDLLEEERMRQMTVAGLGEALSVYDKDAPVFLRDEFTWGYHRVEAVITCDRGMARDLRRAMGEAKDPCAMPVLIGEHLRARLSSDRDRKVKTRRRKNGLGRSDRGLTQGDLTDAERLRQMTIRELIDFLSPFDDDAPVFLRDEREWGFYRLERVVTCDHSDVVGEILNEMGEQRSPTGMPLLTGTHLRPRRPHLWDLEVPPEG